MTSKAGFIKAILVCQLLRKTLVPLSPHVGSPSGDDHIEREAREAPGV